MAWKSRHGIVKWKVYYLSLFHICHGSVSSLVAPSFFLNVWILFLFFVMHFLSHRLTFVPGIGTRAPSPLKVARFERASRISGSSIVPTRPHCELFIYDRGNRSEAVQQHLQISANVMLICWCVFNSCPFLRNGCTKDFHGWYFTHFPSN